MRFLFCCHDAPALEFLPGDILETPCKFGIFLFPGLLERFLAKLRGLESFFEACAFPGSVFLVRGDAAQALEPRFPGAGLRIPEYGFSCGVNVRHFRRLFFPRDERR